MKPVTEKQFCPYCKLELDGAGHKYETQAWDLYNCEYNRTNSEKDPIPEYEINLSEIEKLKEARSRYLDRRHGYGLRNQTFRGSFLMKHRTSNTNSTNGGPSYVRVYDSANNLVAEQAINKRNPLGYIRSVVNSKHKRDLYAQCIYGGMSHDVFVEEFGEVKL